MPDTCGRVAARGGELTGRAAGGELDARAVEFGDCDRTSEPGGGVEIGAADIGAARGGIDGGA